MLGALRSLALACPLLLTSFGTQSCVKSCSEIGCLDGVLLELSSETPLQPGEYTIELVADGESTQCNVVPWSCTGPLTVTPLSFPEESPGSPASTEFELAGTPRTLTIEVRYAGNVVASETIEPSYEVHRPNGEGCPPECRAAFVEVKLAFE